MKWTALFLVGALACGSSQPAVTTPAPAPAAPTLDQMVDAMCACKTPACADQVRAQFPAADKPGDTTPHVAALHETLGTCESTAREGDEVTLIGKMEDAMCACKDSACVDRVQHDFKGFMKKEGERYHGDAKPSPQVLKMAEHMSDCAARAYEASGEKPTSGTGLDHTGGTWHPAPPPGPSDGGAPGDGATGIPECDEALRMWQSYAQCDKIPQAAKDAAGQSLDAEKQAWAELKDAPDEARKAAADGCRQMTDALKQTLDAIGCTP